MASKRRFATIPSMAALTNGGKEFCGRDIEGFGVTPRLPKGWYQFAQKRAALLERT